MFSAFKEFLVFIRGEEEGQCVVLSQRRGKGGEKVGKAKSFLLLINNK